MKTPRSILLPSIEKITDKDIREIFGQFLRVIEENHSTYYADFQRVGFFDRGDPSAFDYTVGNFTTDGNWYDLDLSGIIEPEATLVALRVTVQDDAVGNYIRFRKKGNSNNYNVGMVRTQVVDAYINADIVVPCDADRKIQYYASNTTFSTINVLVKGWWK